MSSNKTKYFSLQELPSYTVRKRGIYSFTSLNEKESTEGDFCSHIHSLRRQFICRLIITDSLSSLSDPFLFFSFCPSLSLPLSFCVFSLPFVKLSTPNPITLQSIFSMPQFSLGNAWKRWVAYSPLEDCPKYACALPLGDTSVPDTLHEHHESAFDSNTYPDLQLSCRLRQYWKINSSFSVFCAQILMFTKIKDDKAEGRNLCRTSIDAARGSGARYGLIFAKLPNTNKSIDINCGFG